MTDPRTHAGQSQAGGAGVAPAPTASPWPWPPRRRSNNSKPNFPRGRQSRDTKRRPHLRLAQRSSERATAQSSSAEFRRQRFGGRAERFRRAEDWLLWRGKRHGKNSCPSVGPRRIARIFATGDDSGSAQCNVTIHALALTSPGGPNHLTRVSGSWGGQIAPRDAQGAYAERTAIWLYFVGLPMARARLKLFGGKNSLPTAAGNGVQSPNCP